MERLKVHAAWLGQSECGKCGIREMALFSELHEADFQLIHQPIHDFSLDYGKVLYRQGDEGKALFTVRHGLMKLEQYLPGGEKRIVRLLRRGDTAGMEAVVGQPYRHTAITLLPVGVCRIPKDVVDRLNRETPRLCRQLMERWQKALNEADAWFTTLTSGSTQARVVRLIMQLIRDSDDSEVFTLMSREDMGAILGISKESASRVVAELKRRGGLRDRGDGYYMGNINILENISES